MGRFKTIRKPEDLWKHFLAYKKLVKDNPRKKVEYVGKEGDKVETPIERPLTIVGFKCYVADQECDIQAYWNNRDEQYTEFSPIITRIREEIRLEQFDGALTGFYNSNLTARLNGLSDKQQLDVKANVNILSIDPLGDQEKD